MTDPTIGADPVQAACGSDSTAISDGLTDYDKFPYASERQISGCIDSLSLAAKRVLEIGLGQGSECELLIRLGALWAGVDQARQVG